ncbi:hypothetical protein BD779DRAFT_93666 [Infundibulicybe gibba]|nr:hypothetical protein BD779DRAFT_93666 [Infundibulicybe gibba]
MITPTPKEHPPPYSPDGPGPSGPQLGHASPGPSVSQIHIRNRKEDIAGTFYVDPQIPSLNIPKKLKSRKGSVPHASFRTREGSIALNLATTGKKGKAIVHVSSRTGNIHLNVLSSSAAGPCIDLDIYSRRGNIVLFIPKTFVGVVQLHTKKGHLEFLPAFASITKTLKSTETESLVLMGQNSSDTADFCQLTSVLGKVTIGIAGEDQLSVPQPGFWKKFKEFFQ